jgi:hypothetical protein
MSGIGMRRQWVFASSFGMLVALLAFVSLVSCNKPEKATTEKPAA